MISSSHLPTSAKITVNNGAAGKAMVVFNSNICSRSTANMLNLLFKMCNTIDMSFTITVKVPHLVADHENGCVHLECFLQGFKSY